MGWQIDERIKVLEKRATSEEALRDAIITELGAMEDRLGSMNLNLAGMTAQLQVLIRLLGTTTRRPRRRRGRAKWRNARSGSRTRG